MTCNLTIEERLDRVAKAQHKADAFEAKVQRSITTVGSLIAIGFLIGLLSLLA